MEQSEAVHVAATGDISPPSSATAPQTLPVLSGGSHDAQWGTCSICSVPLVSGSTCLVPLVSGSTCSVPLVSGSTCLVPLVSGSTCLVPLVSGSTCSVPLVSGSTCLVPLVSGSTCSVPLVSGRSWPVSAPPILLKDLNSSLWNMRLNPHHQCSSHIAVLCVCSRI